MKYKVYRTDFPDGRYYYGFSGKNEKLYAKYFGSSPIVKEFKGQLTKETLFQSDSKSSAKMVEMLYQLHYCQEELCLNKMLNIRLRSDFIKWDEVNPIMEKLNGN